MEKAWIGQGLIWALAPYRLIDRICVLVDMLMVLITNVRLSCVATTSTCLNGGQHITVCKGRNVIRIYR